METDTLYGLYSDMISEEEALDSMDSDKVIYNLYEDIRYLQEKITELKGKQDDT
jgi:hypothetical protein